MGTKMNQSTTERFSRILLGGIFMFLTTYTPISGAPNIVLTVLGLYLMFFGLVGFDLVYSLLNFSTFKQ